MHRLLVDELRRELLVKTGRQWACVTSGSMSPTIQTGDRVLIERVDPVSVRLGDVILFNSHDTWVVHRVIGKYRRSGELMLLEKGDLSDGWRVIPAADVLGRVTTVLRGDLQFDLLGRWGRVVQLTMALQSILRFFGWTLGRLLSAHKSSRLRRAGSHVRDLAAALPRRLLTSPDDRAGGSEALARQGHVTGA